MALNGRSQAEFLSQLFERHGRDIAVRVRQWIANVRTSTLLDSTNSSEDCDSFDFSDALGDAIHIDQVLRGGMGLVFVLSAGISKMAAKTFQGRFLRNSRIRDRFREEAEIWTRLGPHPNILRVSELLTIRERPFIMTEYVRGMDGFPNNLEDVLRQCPAPLTLRPEGEKLVVRWLAEVCSAMLHAAERGLVCHGDLKPSNILLPDTGRAMLADFGLARVADRDVVLGPCGSPGYMALEIWKGEPGDVLSDIFSIGRIMWRITMNRHPEADPRQLDTEGAMGLLVPIMKKCLSENRNLRPPSFQAVYEELVGILDRIDPYPSGTFGVPWPKFLAKEQEPLDETSEMIREISRANNLMSMGISEAALPLLEHLPQTATPSLRSMVLRLRAEANYSLGRYQDAITDALELIENDPRDFKARFELSRAFYGSGDVETARKHRDEANRLVTNDHQRLQVAILDVYLSQGQDPAVLLPAQQVLAGSPGPQTRAVRALSFALQKRYAEAEAEASLALDYDPLLDLALTVRGNALWSLKRYNEAAQMYQRLTEVKPQDPNVWLAAAKAHWMEGQEQEAYQTIELGLARCSKHTEKIITEWKMFHLNAFAAWIRSDRTRIVPG